MTATKHYPPEFDPQIFAIPDPPPQIAAKVLEAARAASVPSRSLSRYGASLPTCWFAGAHSSGR